MFGCRTLCLVGAVLCFGIDRCETFNNMTWTGSMSNWLLMWNQCFSFSYAYKDSIKDVQADPELFTPPSQSGPQCTAEVGASQSKGDLCLDVLCDSVQNKLFACTMLNISLCCTLTYNVTYELNWKQQQAWFRYLEQRKTPSAVETFGCLYGDHREGASEGPQADLQLSGIVVWSSPGYSA